MSDTKSNPIPKSNPGVLENFILVLHQTVPILDRIKRAIEEISNKIPRASKHLDTVTKVTESATIEILNVVENIAQRLDKTQSDLHLLNAASLHRKKLVKELYVELKNLEKLYKGSGSSKNIQAILEKYQETAEEDIVRSRVDHSLEQTKKDSLNIAMSLQVQDITAQQIASVADLIESVRLQLITVLQHFESNITDSKTTLPHRPKENSPNHPDEHLFDAGSFYTHSKERQSSADKIIAEWKKIHSTL